jgi:O-antigen ligase
MVLWLVWLANSMTALLCFLLAASVLVATSFLGLARKLSTVHLLVVGALSISASILFLGVGSSALSAVGRDPTITGRTEVWEVALRFAGNPIVGTGFESFWLGDRLRSIWAIYWWRPNEAHNGYLEIFLSLGWVGLILLAVVMVAGYRNILVDLQRNPSVGRLRLAFFVAVVAYNFTEAAIRGFHPLWVFLLLTILAIPEDSIRSRINEAGKSWTLSSRKLASHKTPG